MPWVNIDLYISSVNKNLYNYMPWVNIDSYMSSVNKHLYNYMPWVNIDLYMSSVNNNLYMSRVLMVCCWQGGYKIDGEDSLCELPCTKAK